MYFEEDMDSAKSVHEHNASGTHKPNLVHTNTGSAVLAKKQSKINLLVGINKCGNAKVTKIERQHTLLPNLKIIKALK